MLLINEGFAEAEIFRMPLDKYTMYTKAAARKQLRMRRSTVQDIAAAVGGLFGEKGALQKYLKQYDEETEEE